MLYNHTRGCIVASQVENALTFFARFKGLMLRASLPEGQALILAPCRSVHMFFMRFSLDVVFADKDYSVVGIEENLSPWQISKTYRNAHFAIELPAGTVSMTNIQTGDQLQIT